MLQVVCGWDVCNSTPAAGDKILSWTLALNITFFAFVYLMVYMFLFSVWSAGATVFLLFCVFSAAVMFVAKMLN